MEALRIAVVPWARPGDVERRRADPLKPDLDRLGDELRPIAAPDALLPLESITSASRSFL